MTNIARNSVSNYEVARDDFSDLNELKSPN